MDPARNLAEGVGAWLQYEFACGRSRLFSERYMSVPIANILYYIYNMEVHAEFLHPILGPAKIGPGRRPEVDFAVINNYPDLQCVLESKWVGVHGLSAEEVLWDLLRLDLISFHTGAKAFFLLAGRRKHIEKFFQSKAFLGEAKDGKFKRLLKLDHRRNPRIRVDQPALDRVGIFKKLFEKYQNVSFSSRITTSLCYSYPKDSPKFQYQVYVWQVISPVGTHRFQPSNHKLFRT